MIRVISSRSPVSREGHRDLDAADPRDCQPSILAPPR
jgi:hypothetical protein